MPITITRGYSFGTTETVDAAKLHKLVDLAVVSGLDLSAFGDDIRTISSITRPTGPKTGDLVWRHNLPLFTSDSNFSGVFLLGDYEIRTPSGQWVPCFRQWGLCTDRFVNNAGSTLRPGDCINVNTGTGNVTLTTQLKGSGSDSSGGIDVVGSALTSTVNAARIVSYISGFATAFANALDTGGAALGPHYCYNGAAADGTWACSANSGLDGIWGVRLINGLPSTGFEAIAMMLFGAPTFRA